MWRVNLVIFLFFCRGVCPSREKPRSVSQHDRVYHWKKCFRLLWLWLLLWIWRKRYSFGWSWQASKFLLCRLFPTFASRQRLGPFITRQPPELITGFDQLAWIFIRVLIEKLITVFRCCHIHDACYERVSKDPDLCTFSSAVYWKIYSRDDTCTGCSKLN